MFHHYGRRDGRVGRDRMAGWQRRKGPDGRRDRMAGGRNQMADGEGTGWQRLKGPDGRGGRYRMAGGGRDRMAEDGRGGRYRMAGGGRDRMAEAAEGTGWQRRKGEGRKGMRQMSAG